MSATDIFTVEPTAAAAQRAADALTAAGLDDVCDCEVAALVMASRREVGGHRTARAVLVLAAEVVELRAQVAALEESLARAKRRTERGWFEAVGYRWALRKVERELDDEQDSEDYAWGTVGCLRDELNAAEADNAALRARVAAHESGLAAMGATIERACEEAELSAPPDRFARAAAEVEAFIERDRARREAEEAAAEAVTP